MPARRRYFLSVVLVILAGAWTEPQARAQSTPAIGILPPYRTRLLGVFNFDTGEPIVGAEVLDITSRASVLTSKTGTISLRFLPDGATLLRIRRVGYEPVMVAVEITPRDTISLTVLMHPSAQTLPAVVSTDSASRHMAPGLRAFEERRRLGFGHFITEAELRKAENKKLTELVRELPGVGVVCPAGGLRRGECWAVSLRATARRALAGNGACEVDLYVDGVLATDNDLEKIRASTLGGVEYYTGVSTIPAEYNRTGAVCGVMLLWSRDR
jgi:hypothetical protein